MKNLRSFCSRHGKKVLAVLGSVLVLISCMILPTFASSPIDPLLPLVGWHVVDRLQPPDNYESLEMINWNNAYINGNSNIDYSWIVSGLTLLINDNSIYYRLYWPQATSISYQYDSDAQTKTVSFTTRTTNTFTFLTYVYDVSASTSTFQIHSSSSVSDVNELVSPGASIQMFYDPLSLSGDNVGVFYSLFGNSTVTNYPSFIAGREVGNEAGYDEGYNVGYTEGAGATESEAYDAGYNYAMQSISSGQFGQNLLGETLSAPIKALNQFTLVTTPSGFNITLGLVVGCAIALTLFIAFLKLFAGG